MTNVRWFLVVLWAFLGGSLVAGGLTASSQESRIKLLNARSQFIINDPLANFSGSLIVPGAAVNQVQGRSFQFDKGKIEVGSVRGELQGLFNPASPGTISLNGNSSFVGDHGSVLTGVSVSGANNRLAGWLSLQSPLTFSGSDASLDLGIESYLTKDVALSGGFLRLFADLNLAPGVVISGGGRIDPAGKSIAIRSGSTVVTDRLQLVGSASIFLYDKMLLAGAWTLGDSVNPISVKITGLGNELDLSQGGTLVVQPGCTLVLEDVVLSGLGVLNGRIQLTDSTSSLVLIGCTLNFTGSYSVALGTLRCEGRDSTFVTGPNLVTVTGSGLLAIDGVTLYYDSVNIYPQASGIAVTSPSNIVERNDGKVLSVHKKQEDPRLVMDDSLAVCSGSLDLTADQPMFFRGTHSQNISLTGVDLFVNCVVPGRFSKPALISVAAGKRAVVSDIVINNFDPAYVRCAAGASLSYADNVELNFTQSITLTNTLSVTGNVFMRGQGNSIDCSRGGVISIASGASLVMQDLVLAGLGNGFGSIKMTDTSSSLILKNVTVSLAGSYTQTAGVFLFAGTKSSVITGSNTLTFSGTASCVIDGVHVVCDQLSYIPANNTIFPAQPDDVHLIYRKGGAFVGINPNYAPAALLVSTPLHTLQQSELLSASRPLTFSGPVVKSVLSGDGMMLSFPFNATKVVVIPPGKRVEFQDIVLKDLRLNHFSMGSLATIAFGDGAVVQLSSDLILTSNIYISGAVVIDCGGHRILSEAGSGFVVEAGGSLELRNGFLLDLDDATSPLSLMSRTSKLVLNDMTCSLKGDFTFSRGALDIAGNTNFSTRRKLLKYSSTNRLTIRASSMMYFDQGSVFRYDAVRAPNGLVFTDKTSSIYLDGATISAGMHGLNLAAGTLWINGICSVKGDVGASAYGLHFKSNSFDTHILLKSTFDVAGLVVND